MKAYVYGANGAEITDVAKPAPKGTQVLVRVRACQSADKRDEIASLAKVSRHLLPHWRPDDLSRKAKY